MKPHERIRAAAGNFRIITSIGILMIMSSSCNLNYPNYSEDMSTISRDLITYFQLTPIDSNIKYENDNISIIDDSIVICNFLSGETEDADGKDIPLTQRISISSLLDTSKRVEWDFGYFSSTLASFFSYDGEVAYGYLFFGDGLIKVNKNQYGEIIAPLSQPKLICHTRDYVLFDASGQKKLFNYRKGELIWNWNYDKSKFKSCIIDKYFVKEDIINSINGDTSDILITCHNLESKEIVWQREYKQINSISDSNVYISREAVDWLLSSDERENIIVQSPDAITFINVKSNKVKFKIYKPALSSQKVPEFVAYPLYYCAFDDNIRCYNIKTKSLIWSIKSSSPVKGLDIWRQHLLYLSNDSLYIAPLNTLKIDKVFHENVYYNELKYNIHNNYFLVNKKIYN